ncbi:MAG: LPS-assembly protein LptD [Phycisphaeraceae bacterium]|nr:MAG: LPS-assembly protein LptD [Phycisphaeraceae bacterium]
MTSTRHGPTRASSGIGSLAAVATLAAIALLCLQSTRSLAQPAGAPIDGRSFSGIDLPADPQRADVVMQSLRGDAWREGTTQRLLLDGDVRVRIGVFDFVAARAVVWIEPVQLAGQPLEQVAIYFDDVRDPGADAAVAQTAERLLVTAIVEGQLSLRVDRLREGRPTSAFLIEGEARLARYLSGLVGTPPRDPEQRDPFPPTVVERRDPAAPTDALVPDIEGRLAPTVQAPPIFAEEGVVTFFGPDRTLVTGETENALVITGGVVAQYTDISSGRTLQISAESLVAFLDPGSVADIFRFGPGEVRGIYLEGDVVASDGRYTLRGPRFYYDVANNRGVVLDAVFWTYDRTRGLPLYVRAKSIRQESANQWTAGQARLSNTAFFEPHFTIGASSVTITRDVRPGEDVRTTVDIRDLTLRGGDLPLLYVPRVRGEPERIGPLRRVGFETEGGRPIVRTRWNLISLLGLEPPEGLEADLLLDGYFGRGPAAGIDAEWRTLNADGAIFSYYIYDDGRDRLSSGARIDRDNDHRGMVAAEHRWRLGDDWTLFLEGSYISDETFVDAFFPRLGETRREFTNAAYARYLDDVSLFSAQVRGTLNDFTPNQYLLQSQGYQVQRVPELAYMRPADPWLGGLVTHTSDTRLSRLSLQFTEPSASRLGFDTSARSQAALGIEPDESPADRLSAAGIPSGDTHRFDTRHELSMPLAAGPVNVTPFVVGRATVYDRKFGDLRGPGGDDDQYRLWGAAGMRLSTSIVRINDSVRSQLFDLNRIRHILEPSATVWASATTIDNGDLPVYDERIEAISEGAAFRVGLTSTWQTRRGGPDGERTVDWIVLRGDYVRASSDTDRTSPLGRFFESRPELSHFGEYFTAESVMRLTDALALTASGVYDVDEDALTTGAAGFLLDHGSLFSSFAEIRRIRPLDSTFLDVGAAYQLTRKYTLEGYVVYDLDETTFQSLGMRLGRRFPQWMFEVGVDYNDVRDDLSLRMSLRPIGLGPELRTREMQRGPDVFDRPEPAPIPGW